MYFILTMCQLFLYKIGVFFSVQHIHLVVWRIWYDYDVVKWNKKHFQINFNDVSLKLAPKIWNFTHLHNTNNNTHFIFFLILNLLNLTYYFCWSSKWKCLYPILVISCIRFVYSHCNVDDVSNVLTIYCIPASDWNWRKN